MKVIAEPPRPASPAASAAAYRLRWAQAFLFIAVWMALGWTFHLGSNAYLLLGVPLVIAFQLAVRREPLVTLWVRRAHHFRLNRAGWIFAGILAMAPAWKLARTGFGGPIIPQLWLLAAVAGAFPAGFALQNFNRQDGRALAYGFGTAGLIGCVFMLLPALRRDWPSSAGAAVAVGLNSLLLYVPVCFVVEEVAFRGLLDAHLHHPGDPQPAWSATALSCAWGLWHLPILPSPGANILLVVGSLVMVHGFTGIYLSNTWRSCGNLFAPALIHAFIDAVRNGLWRS
jgi:hypothetical protein